jgi:hypothetical protein
VGLGLAIFQMYLVPVVAAAPLAHRVDETAMGKQSGSSLSRAPAGLQAAVHRTLGAPASPASRDSVFQRAKLTASDAAGGDNLGDSVAIYGSTAVVGAYLKSSFSGAAYVYVETGGTWSQQAELTASDAPAGEFGVSVAIYRSTVVVGAQSKNSSTGAAYVFVRSGTTWSQQAELTASDATAGDEFGQSVAINGSTVVIGAYSKNSFTGAAYVFARSGTTWSQQAELTASGGGADEDFGVSVAISGSSAVVGAFAGDSSGAGAAYVFARSGSAWSQQAKLTASDATAGDEFGRSVAISGSTLVVGAWGNSSFTGAAYVFARSGATWSQQEVLTASDPAVGDRFGVSVMLSGSTAVVGAYLDDSGAGAAYVFERSGTGWSQETKLTAFDAAANDQFGFSLAVAGSTALVGARGSNSAAGAAYVFVLPAQQAELSGSDTAAGDDFGYSVAISGSTAVVGAYTKECCASDMGAAYVFVRSGTNWSQQAKLTASDAAVDDFFGASVAISGSTVVVGAPGKNSATGAAYVFARSGTAWSQQAELTASDGVANDGFGQAVAISGSTAVIGASAENTSTAVGAAYVFVISGGVWTQQAKMTASDAANGDDFGFWAAISGSTLVIGAPGKDSGAGAAYVFVRSGTVWSQQSKLTASDAATGDGLGQSVAISGSTAIVGAESGNSNTGAAYVFVRSGTNWSQQAKLTASDAASGEEFGISVAISGSTAIVGAQAKNAYTGAGYVFSRSGTAWSQQAELTASDGATESSFGESVAISGSTAIVGAYTRNANTGASYLFTNL